MSWITSVCVCNFLKLCLASKIGVQKDRPAQILEGWEYRWLRYFQIFFHFPAVGVLKSSDAEEAITSSIQPLLKQSQPAHPILPMYIFQIWPKAFPGFDQIPLFGTGFLWSAILVFESIQRPGILFNTRRPLQLEYPIVTISSLQCDAWKDVCVCVCFFFFRVYPWKLLPPFFKNAASFWKMINSLTPTIDNGWKLGNPPTGLKNGGWTCRGHCYSLSPVIMVLWKMTAIGEIYPFFTEPWVWEGVDMLRPFLFNFTDILVFVIIGDLMKNRENKIGGGICQKWGP